MDESVESREYVAGWLREVPEFMAALGIEDRPDLAARLSFLGSGADADVIYLGEHDGVKRILKVTSDSGQAALSMAAFEDRPAGIVPIYDVIETDIEPRAQLPELPRRGEEPQYPSQTWGVVGKLTVPLSALREMPRETVAGESSVALLERYGQTWRAYDAGGEAKDPSVEAWRSLYAAALAWVDETCRAVGSKPVLDLHEGNWGVDPETGELLLIDLGQCYPLDREE